MFFQAVNDESSASNVEPSRLASAVYFVTYSDLTGDTRCLSLPWIFVDHLLSARRLNTNPETMSSTLRSPHQSLSVLQQLSKEVVEFKESDHRLPESRIRRNKAFRRLSFVMTQIHNVQVVLSVFGSHVTGLDDTASSLDVLVDVASHKMSQKISDQIMSLVRREYNLPRQRSLKLDLKPVTIIDDVNRVKMCLYTSVTCTRRTVYIISAIINNIWIFPVLQTMLAWAKQNKITGNDRGSTMTAEQLVLLFLSHLSQNVADHQPVATEDKNRVMDLIVQNHFLICGASTCCHAKEPSENSPQFCDHHGEDRYADVILNFLHRSSCLQGEVLKEVIDPACEGGKTKLFKLKESQYHRLAERMLKAYHTLAQSGHFVHLVSESKLTDGHLLMDLPQQVCKRILLTEKSYAEKLKRESKAELVAIRRRPYRDCLAGLVLEAWGSLQSLQLIHDLICDEAKIKPSLLSPDASHFATENAYVTIFKNSSSESSPVMFVKYSGPCQANHDRFERQLPRVISPDPHSSYGRDKFVERSLRQLNVIVADYDENVHGKMRAVISYGTFYVANCSIQEVQEVEFDGLFSGSPADRDPIHPRGRTRGRGRRRQGRGPGRSFVPRIDNYCRTSFIPTGNPNIDSVRLQAFLQNSGFLLAEETVDYRLTLKLHISGQQLKLEAVVVLDENFNLTYVNMPDIKWLCVNIVSADKDSDYRPCDCRFKIQSRTKRTALQLRRETDDFGDIIANHRRMLLRTGNDIYGVHQDFLSRIRFVRKKHTKVYQLAANQHAATTDSFLYGMSIKINYGTEYSRPSPTGVFQSIDRNRVEITAIPELPNLRDKDKMRTFFSRTCEFAEELGSILE